MTRCWKFGDNVNTDEIIPGRYNITIVPSELAENVFCDIRPEFAANVNKGDVLIGGKNFGCGSSREHAPIAIKGSGVQCIVAESYARIFFRNAVNIGLPILTCQGISTVEDGSELMVELTSGLIQDRTKGQDFQAQPLPDFIMKIVKAGGIIPYLQKNEIETLE